MTSYRLSPQALQDLIEISAYIEQLSPQAAADFIEKAMQQCQRLADFPNMGRRWDELIPPLRSFPVDNYAIFYRSVDGGIEVVRVVSGYRDLQRLFALEDGDKEKE